MIKRILNRLRPSNPWHYIWIAILASEFFTFILNALQSYLRWGYISGSLIEIGVIDALVCSAIVAPTVIYFLKSANDKLALEIAQHNLAKRNLEEGEEKLRALFDFANDVVLVADGEGNLIDANKKAEGLLGYTKSELTSMHISKLHPKEELDRTISAFKEMVRNGSGILHDSVVLTKDKRKMHFDISGSVVRYVNGEISFIGIFRDITERKAAEEALERSEELFSLAFHSSPVGMAISTRTDGLILDANEAYAKVTGYQREELLGKTMVELDSLFAVSDRQRLLDILERNGEVKNIEIPIRRRSGDIRIAQISVEAIEIENEQCSLSLVQDITERKLAEDALNESRDQFKKAVDKSPRPMALVNSDGIIEYINQKAIQVFGYLPEDIPDMDHWWVRAYPDKEYRDEVIAQWMRLVDEARLNNHEIEKKEYYVTCKDGRVLVTSIYGIWVADKVLAMFDDITDRKKMEESLKEDRDRLEELVAKRAEEISNLHRQLLQSQKLEAVGILAGGVAHEFSNILATMKGSAYLIQKKLSDDSTVNKYADQIVSSIAKASSLSQGLLSFSRKQIMSLRTVHINNTVERIFKLLRQFIGEHIELRLLLAEREATVMADAHQLEQVLVNLAINAKDAMPEGGIMTIRTELMQMDEEFIKKHGFGIRGPYVVLTVSDTGIGIKEDVLSKIFEPFFTTKPVGKGSGLGLAITYGIIKQHNGFIDVASLPGQGTTFEIYIPTVDTKVTQELATDTLPIGHGYETVLLAEDDPEARAVMGELLEITGYIVLMAGDGEEAVRIFAASKNKIQLVITDVRMPKKDGRAVYEEISRIAPSTKFLFMSGYTADILDSYGIMEDGLEFISKAACPDELLLKVREILDS